MLKVVRGNHMSHETLKLYTPWRGSLNLREHLGQLQARHVAAVEKVLSAPTELFSDPKVSVCKYAG